jgi:pimeloyl-ACP methyl ester carboxylesterase
MAAVEAGTASPWQTIDASYLDMEAGLKWLDENQVTGPRFVLGSSFSAMLVFRLAAEHPVAGVLAFSPGEYDDNRPDLVRQWAAAVTAPVLSVAAPDEEALVSPVASAVTAPGSQFVTAPAGRHGASILDADERNWMTLATFLSHHSGGPPRREEVTIEVAGTPIVADWYATDEQTETTPVVALFHQGGGSARGEYGFLVPRLLDLGFEVLAVDLHGGGDRFGRPNRTMARTPEPDDFSYCDALPEMEGVLAHLRSQRPGAPIVAWGSSYSAALVMRVAAADAEGVIRALAFSPAAGEPMDDCGAEPDGPRVSIPLLVVRPDNEATLPNVVPQLNAFRAAGYQVLIASPGVHGSSALNPLRVRQPTTEAWAVVEAFLREAVAPALPPDSPHDGGDHI